MKFSLSDVFILWRCRLALISWARCAKEGVDGADLGVAALGVDVAVGPSAGEPGATVGVDAAVKPGEPGTASDVDAADEPAATSSEVPADRGEPSTGVKGETETVDFFVSLMLDPAALSHVDCGSTAVGVPGAALGVGAAEPAEPVEVGAAV
mmetsp:Transcript_145316/g.256193  ORF Transcript_145316/g.256193 Transcript_145316/m.256193 type:complete len:152 (+) Transcript_145316:921-1376(+)